MAKNPRLQPQRTALAWSRTSFAMFVNALLTIRAAAGAESHRLYVTAGLLGAASAALAAIGGWRQRMLLLEGEPRSPPALLMFLAACCSCIAFGAAAIGFGA